MVVATRKMAIAPQLLKLFCPARARVWDATKSGNGL